MWEEFHSFFIQTKVTVIQILVLIFSKTVSPADEEAGLHQIIYFQSLINIMHIFAINSSELVTTCFTLTTNQQEEINKISQLQQ